MKQYEEYDAYKIKEGGIYLFDDIDYTGEIKCTRPVLVMKVVKDNGTFLGFKLTSKERDYDPYSYALLDWKSSELRTASSVRCDKPLFVNRKSLHTIKEDNDKPYIIGTASPRDLKAVSDRFTSYVTGLKNLAEAVEQATGRKVVYLIRQTDTYSDGTVRSESRVYDDTHQMQEDWERCRATKSTALVDGKMLIKATAYEKCCAPVSKDGTILTDETKVIGKKNYDDLLKQQRARGKR